MISIPYLPCSLSILSNIASFSFLTGSFGSYHSLRHSMQRQSFHFRSRKQEPNTASPRLIISHPSCVGWPPTILRMSVPLHLGHFEGFVSSFIEFPSLPIFSMVHLHNVLLSRRAKRVGWTRLLGQPGTMGWKPSMRLPRRPPRLQFG